MDIEDLVIELAVSSDVDGLVDVVYGLQQPFVAQRHRQGESSRFHQSATFLLLRNPVHHVVQPLDL